MMFQAIACDVSSKILGREVATGSPSLWYAEAKAWLKGESAHEDFVAQLQENLLELCRVLEVEIYTAPWRQGERPARQLEEDSFLYGDADGVHSVWRWDAQVMNFLEVKNTAPKRQPEDWPELARRTLRHLAEQLEGVRQHAGEEEEKLQKRLGDQTLVLARVAGLNLGLDESALMACLIEPGAVADILDCQLEVALAHSEALARRGLNVARGGGDLAAKKGPIYSPGVFHKLMLPRLEKLAARSNELGLHYIWCTDGKLWPVTDMLFIDAGFPGYGEVDREATMTVEALHERYPGLVVWANVSVSVMRTGSRAEVYDHCRQILAESGGRRYVHGCSNAILPGTPPENVLAMIEARNDYAREQRHQCGQQR